MRKKGKQWAGNRHKRTQNRILHDLDRLCSVRGTKHIDELIKQHQRERREKDDVEKNP